MILNDHLLVEQVNLNNNRQIVASLIDDGLTNTGTQRYRVYLDNIEIGKIFARGTYHYAKTQIEYLNIDIKQEFDNLENARDWLVNTYYDLLDNPIEIELSFLEIWEVFRGSIWIGDYRENRNLWLTTLPDDRRKKFNNSHEALDYIINLSFKAKEKPHLSRYLVDLESEFNFRNVTVEIDRDTINWENWLAHYNHNECEEFEILQIIRLN